MKVYKMLYAAVALALLCSSQALAGKLLFEKELDSDIRFHLVHDTGIIIVGTEQTIYGFDPATGAEKWKIEKLMKNYDVDSVKPLPGLPFMVYQVKEGFIAPPKIRCLDILTGQVVWEMNPQVPEASAMRILKKMSKDPPEFSPGELVAVATDPERGQLLIGTAVVTGSAVPVLWQGKAGKSKPENLSNGAVLGVNLETGKINFLYALPEESSYAEAPPQVVGDLVVLDWLGLHTFKVADGAPIAGLKMERALKGGRMGKKKTLSNTNGLTQVENGIAYMVAGEKVVAIDINSGALKWETKELGTALPEMYLVGDKLVARMGGTFIYYEGGDPKFKEMSPYGVVILDKATGQVLTDTGQLDAKMGKKGKKYEITLTTPLLIRDNVVYFATRGSLRAIDLKTLGYKYVVPLDAAEAQDKLRVYNKPGMKEVVNLDEDVPVQVTIEGGKVYVLTSQSTIAFNMADGSLLWWHSIPPPKLDLAMRMAKGFAKAVATLQAAGAAWGAAVGSGSTFDTPERAWNDVAKRWNAPIVKENKLLAGLRTVRLQEAEKYGQYNYCMTGETNKPEVVGVSLRTGNADRQAKLEGRGAEYRVDESTGILINVSQQFKKKVQIFDMKS